MPDSEQLAGSVGRRHFVVRTILAIQSAIAAALAFVLGATTLTPSFNRRESMWLRAAALDSLPDDQPMPVTLRVTSQDGYSQVVDRTVIYLVRTGDNEVRALQSTSWRDVRCAGQRGRRSAARAAAGDRDANRQRPGHGSDLMGGMRALLSWLDGGTGVSHRAHSLLEEPLPR